MARLGYQKVEASEAIGALGGRANRKCVMCWFVDAEKISGRVRIGHFADGTSPFSKTRPAVKNSPPYSLNN